MPIYDRNPNGISGRNGHVRRCRKCISAQKCSKRAESVIFWKKITRISPCNLQKVVLDQKPRKTHLLTLFQRKSGKKWVAHKPLKSRKVQGHGPWAAYTSLREVYVREGGPGCPPSRTPDAQVGTVLMGCCTHTDPPCHPSE